MNIKNAAEPFEIEEKRFYIPGTIIESKCPKCGAEHVKDLGDNYLAYPMVNEPMEVGCCCSEFWHDWNERVILRVTLDTAPPP